jgi:hypothetical protein
MRRAALVTTALIVFGVLPAAAQAVVLRYAPAQGQSLSYHDVVKTAAISTTSGAVPVGEKMPPMNSEVTLDTNVAIRVLGTDSKGNHDLELTVQSGDYSIKPSWGGTGSEPPLEVQHRPVPKLRYHMKVSSQGEIVEMRSLDASSRESVVVSFGDFELNGDEYWFFWYTHPLPDKEVGVGDKWATRVRLPTSMLPKGDRPSAPSHLVFNSRLVSLTTLRGHRVAKIHSYVELPASILLASVPPEQGQGPSWKMSGQITLSSDWYYDYNQSAVVQNDGTMTVQLNMQVTPPSEEGGGSVGTTVRGKANSRSTLVEQSG